MPSVIECPSCNRRLRLPDSLIGQPVRCPLCHSTFPAQTLATPPPPPIPMPFAPEPPTLEKQTSPEQPANGVPLLGLEEGPTIGLDANLPPPPAPLRPVLVEEAHRGPAVGVAASSELRPCPFCDELIPRIADRCRFCGEDLAKERPEWERYGAVRRDCEPHRGGLVLTLGVVGLVASLLHVFCLIGLPLSLTAWVMGQSDLAQMEAGNMDPQGESNTRAGKVCGIIGTVFGCLWLLLIGLLFLQILLD